MNLRLLLAVAAILAASAPAAAATRNFSVTDFSRIRLDGPYRIKLTTGVAPFARATGSTAAIDGISIEMIGQTVIIRRNSSSWGGGFPGEIAGPVEISLGTHDLSAAWLNGAGGLAIDKVRGQKFEISIEGPGSISVGDLNVDSLQVDLTGSGSAELDGKAAEVRAIVRGTAALQAPALVSKDATLGAEGNAVIRTTVTNTAKVNILGTALVELGGSPACTVKASGSASVSGCR